MALNKDKIIIADEVIQKKEAVLAREPPTKRNRQIRNKIKMVDLNRSVVEKKSKVEFEVSSKEDLAGQTGVIQILNKSVDALSNSSVQQPSARSMRTRKRQRKQFEDD